MSVQVITGYTGTKHITPKDDAALIRGIASGASNQMTYNLPVYNRCQLTIVSNTSVKIDSGAVVVQGRFGIVDEETLTINSIATNTERIDVIVCRYTHDSVTLIDDMELAVLQGTSVAYGNTPTPPTPVVGILDNGAATSEFWMYSLRIRNNAGTVSINDTNNMIDVPSLADLGSVYNAQTDYVVDEGTDINGWKYRKWHSGRMEAHVYLNSLTTSDYGTATTVSGVSRRQLNSIPTVPSAFSSLDYCAASGNNSGAWIVGGLNASDQPIVYQQAVSGTNVVARVCIELKGTWQ